MSAVDPFRFAMNLKAVWKIIARRRWPQMLATSKKKPREENFRGFLGSLESKKKTIDHIRWDPDGENAQTTIWLRFRSPCLCTRPHYYWCEILVFTELPISFFLVSWLLTETVWKHPRLELFKMNRWFIPVEISLIQPSTKLLKLVGDWRLRLSGTDTRRDFEQKKEEKEKLSLSLIDWQYILFWITFAS